MLIAVAVGSSSVPSEAATSPCINPHCYGIVEWDNPPLLGNISGHLKFSNLDDNADYPAFINLEMWVFTDTTPDWVEQGVTTGWDVSGYFFYNQNWYMADMRRNGTSYNEHYATFSTSPNTDYPLGMHYHGNGYWYIQRSDQGTWFTSGGDPNSPGIQAEAGTETYNDVGGLGTTSACGWITSLEYQISGSYVTHATWPTSYLYQDNPPSTAGWDGGTHVGGGFQTHGGC